MSETGDSEDNFAGNSMPPSGALIVKNFDINTKSTGTTTNVYTTIWDPTNPSPSSTITIGPLKYEGNGQHKVIRGEETKNIIDKLKIEDFPLGRFKHAIDLFREALSCYENGDYMASTIMCRVSIESMLILCIMQIERSSDGKHFEVKFDDVKINKGKRKYSKYSENLEKAKAMGYLDDNVYQWLSEKYDENDKNFGSIRYSGDFVAHYSEKLINELSRQNKSIVPINLWIDSGRAKDIIEKTCITLKSINKNYKNQNRF